jgi:hypothetical protein
MPDLCMNNYDNCLKYTNSNQNRGEEEGENTALNSFFFKNEKHFYLNNTPDSPDFLI